MLRVGLLFDVAPVTTIFNYQSIVIKLNRDMKWQR